MNSLMVQQRGLLELLKQRPVSGPSDPWLTRVASSPELGMMQEIALWWRCFQISAECRYTSRLLKRLNAFESTVEAYFRSQPTAPFIEKLASEFLASLETHPNPVVRSVAESELAMRQLSPDLTATREVYWDRNPELTFQALERGGDLPEEDTGYSYTLRIGHRLPGSVECVRISRSVPACNL